MSERRASGAAISSRNSTRIPAARLFFALWPDQGSRIALSRWADALRDPCGGRRVRDDQLHLTLAFLGDVPLDRIPVIAESATRIAARRFTLRISGTGFWAKKHLAFAVPDEAPAALIELVKELLSAIRQAGLDMKERAYVPHITLLRNARCGEFEQQQAAFDWHVDAFALVRSKLSTTGPHYTTIGRWPLNG